MKRASRELGYGDDWHKALEHVKDNARAAGQAAAIDPRAGARGDRISWRMHDLVTIPAAREGNLANGDDDAASGSW